MKKKQHYVPQFYLKNFAIHKKSGEYSIRCYNKKRDKWYNSNITQVAMERYFYDKRDPPVIENYFSQLEGQHATVYHKIVDDQTIKNLTNDDKLSMAEYIFTQNERTRSTRIRNIQIVKIVYKNLERQGKLPPYEKLDDRYKKWLLESRGAMGQFNIMFNPIEDEQGNLQEPKEIVEIISKLDWILVKNNLKLEFYTSDHPVMVWNPPPSEDGVIQGYGVQSYNADGVEIYFPLTPRLCLVLFDGKVSEYKDFRLTKEVIQEELDWINTQIIAMAHRTVFTKNNDFQFVRKRIKDVPELKDPNRNRLYF
ncbi:hypothetical protein ES703_60135 [subsurface metagenome]